MAFEFDTLCQIGTDPLAPHYNLSSAAILMVHLDTPGQGFELAEKWDVGTSSPSTSIHMVSHTDGYAHYAYTAVSPMGLWRAALADPPPPIGTPDPPTWAQRVFATLNVYWGNVSPPAVPHSYNPTLFLEAHRGDTVAQLNWTEAAKCDPRGTITSYTVLRNGGVIASLPPTQLAYLDTGLNNASSYSYLVRASWTLPGLRYSGGGTPSVSVINGNSNTVQLRKTKESWGMIATHRL